MYLNFQHLVDSFLCRDDLIYAKMLNGERFVSTSYQQLYEKSRAVATYLQNVCKLKKGNKVGLISENRPEWMMSYFGIVYNGLIAVPFDSMLSFEELKKIIKASDVDIIFISLNIFNKVKHDKEILSSIKEWIIFDDDISLKEIATKITLFEHIFEKSEDQLLKREELSKDDPASLIFTSGTTGKSKAVLLSHNNFMHQVNNLHVAAKLTESDIVLSVLPLHHTFQFSIELTILGVGAAITYVDSIKPNKIREAISTTKVTVMIGIPTLYAKILDGINSNVAQLNAVLRSIIQFLYMISEISYRITKSSVLGVYLFRFLREKAGFSSVRFMISGAAPLSQIVSRGYAIYGFNLANGYGLTEASPVVSVGSSDGFVDNRSVGNLIPKEAWKILDPDEEGVGEICVKGENVMLGYYNDPKSTADVLSKDGWLKTGDMGYIRRRKNKEFLYITGRYKNIIVTGGGKNVYPDCIEEIINEHPYILESLVIGVPISEKDMSEVVCALIVLNIEYLSSEGIDYRSETLLSEIDIYLRTVNSHLNMYQKIRGYEVRYEEFHKNSTRKIKRYQYRGKDFRYLLNKHFKH